MAKDTQPVEIVAGSASIGSITISGSNVEQTIGSAIPTKANLMGISDGTNIRAFSGNLEGTLLASAARTGNTNSPNQTNYNASGVLVIINVTANPGAAETLTLLVSAIDVISGTAATIANSGVVITAANGVRSFFVYPGAVETLANSELFVQGIALPRTWRASVIPSAAGSWTYSLSYSLIL